MKIYQLHKYGGQYEDAYDDIIGSYLRKSRVEEAKIKAEQKELAHIKRCNKCSKCPVACYELQQNTFETMRDTCQTYCSESQIYEDTFGFGCENYEAYWDESYFRIEEVEVIE